MYTSNGCSHYFIVRREAPDDPSLDLIISDDGIANVTTEDMDFSGRSFRILESPFQKSCYIFALMEADQVPDVIKILRKAYPDISQIVFSKSRGGRKSFHEYGTLAEATKKVFWSLLEAKGISLEQFILDNKYIVIIDGVDDILGDMIKSRLFDIDNIVLMENLNDPQLFEKYLGLA